MGLTKTRSKFPQRVGGNPKKADAALISQRIEIIYDLMQKGYRRSEILRFVETNRYVIDKETGRPKDPLEPNPLFDYRESMLDIYIGRANKQFEDLANESKKKNLGIAIARYNMLFRMALQDKDVFNAVRAQNSLDKVQGITTITEADINVRGKSNEELQARLVAIFIEARNRSNRGQIGESADYEVLATNASEKH